MSYSVETTSRFDKEFKKLDRYTQIMIKAWIDKNLEGCTDPRQHEKGLTRLMIFLFYIIYHLVKNVNHNVNFALKKPADEASLFIWFY